MADNSGTFLEIFGYRITGWPATIALIGIMCAMFGVVVS